MDIVHKPKNIYFNKAYQKFIFINKNENTAPARCTGLNFRVDQMHVLQNFMFLLLYKVVSFFCLELKMGFNWLVEYYFIFMFKSLDGFTKLTIINACNFRAL